MNQSRKLLATAAVLLLASCVPAFADTVDFTFSFANSTESGSGILVTSTTATPGQYLVTDVQGTADGSTITGVIAPGVYPNNPGPPSDNLLFYPASGGGLLDFNGLSFSTQSGLSINVYFLDGSYTVDTNNDNSFDVATFSAAPTPEPESLVMVGTGLLGAFGMLRRRRQA
ncbi:MAG: PEP-CTERM sorting domain-containing protein [Acidobacteriota bacterium]|nr:PEP-CTERM sorting domain-containing protein [Acidobacteriota bacterium]